MTTDFRALCAEAFSLFDGYDNGQRVDWDSWKKRARAALADEPAAGEPASVTGQPSDEELALIYHDCCGGCEFMDQGGFEDAARAVLARWGRPAPAPPADVSQLSDGYHTFAELYEHRHSLMLALMRALPRICWFSRRHADGELPFGSDDWFIVGAELPGAPITYHLPAALYSLAQKTGALELPAGRPWDGHSAADVVHRLRDWAIEPAPPVEGEWQTGLPSFAGFYYVRGLLDESIGGDNRPVYVNPKHFVWGFWEQDDPEWIGLDSDITPDNIQWKPAAQPPTPPAEGEVAELVEDLREQANHGYCEFISGDDLRRAADLLQRLIPLQPVSERPPEDQPCWWFEPDEEDDEA